MRLLLLISLMFFAGTHGAVSAEPSLRASALAAGLAAVSDKDWTAAVTASATAGPEGRDVIEWHRLRAGGQAGFDAYLAFLERRPDWPGLSLLRVRGETAIPKDAAPETVLRYFDGRVPETGIGVLRLVRAHAALGHDGDAEALAVLAWRSRTLTADVERLLLKDYGEMLKEHHTARLDDLLWRGRHSAARRMLPRVSDGWKKLAEARIALAKRAAGVDDKIAAVPKALQDDPGLAYERFNWRARKGLGDSAIELAVARSTGPDALGRPAKWANWRRIYARRLMRDGKPAEAYRLASQHYLIDGSNFADLEWLSGFIALRMLDDPELALLHFDRFRESVATPISLGRAGYWQGRAYAAMGDTERASAAYALGAQHQTSFYGQLAAEAAGLATEAALAGKEVFPPLSETPIAQNSVYAAAILLLEAGDLNLAERFLTHLSESLPREQAGSLANAMIARGEPHLALMIAKRKAREAVVLPRAYFPLSEGVSGNETVPRALALSIARRESEFDPVVISPAGARGLMQVMPGTAKDVAGELGIPYDRDALTADPAYNVQLGTAYLAGLIEIFGPAPVLVSAGYNAGPGRSVDWVEARGDPRSAGVDIVDWIEMVPFRETRNYVMRVAESIWVYEMRLTGSAPKQSFTEMLRAGLATGETPTPNPKPAPAKE